MLKLNWVIDLKKNIILGISLLVIALILIIIKSMGSYLEGTVVDINYHKDNKSSILMNVKDVPYTVYFENIDISKVELSNNIKVKTTGVVRESYPAQVDALSLKIKDSYSTVIKGKYDPSVTDNIKTIVFNSLFYEEESSYMSRFKTKKITNLTDFNEFVSSRKILVPEETNIKDLFINYFAVISYSNMSSSGILDFGGLYKNNNNIYVHVDITSSEVVTTDLITRGVISFIPREYETFEAKTLSKYTYE